MYRGRLLRRTGGLFAALCIGAMTACSPDKPFPEDHRDERYPYRMSPGSPGSAYRSSIKPNGRSAGRSPRRGSGSSELPSRHLASCAVEFIEDAYSAASSLRGYHEQVVDRLGLKLSVVIRLEVTVSMLNRFPVVLDTAQFPARHEPGPAKLPADLLTPDETLTFAPSSAYRFWAVTARNRPRTNHLKGRMRPKLLSSHPLMRSSQLNAFHRSMRANARTNKYPDRLRMRRRLR